MRVFFLIVAFTLFAAFRSPATGVSFSDWFHFRHISSGGEIQSLGGYVDLPLDVDPARCHLTLTIGSRVVARWFPDTSARTVRFDFSVYESDFPHRIVLLLSDRPLALRSIDELEGADDHFIRKVEFGTNIKDLTVVASK